MKTTVNPDGSYDCSVEATSPNSILMSLTNDDSDRYPKYEAVMENSDGEAVGYGKYSDSNSAVQKYEGVGY